MGFEESEDSPKRRGRRVVARNDPPEPSAPPPVPASRKPGLPRTGKWPARRHRVGRKYQRGHAWALSDEWMPIFLDWYARCGNIHLSASKAGIHWCTAYRRLRERPDFKEQAEERFEEFKSHLDAIALDRGINGDDVWKLNPETGELQYGGKLKNPLLFMFVVKRFIREYRDNFQPKEEDASGLSPQTINLYLAQGFKLGAIDQAEMPSFEEFARQQMATPAAIEAETKEEKRTRLLAELAALDGPDEPPPNHADV